MKQVFVGETELTLPTYQPGPADPEPPLLKEFTPRGEPVYPYSTQELLGREAVERQYRALVLENDFIKVTVLPELGGRIYSAFDKVNRHELFYANRTIKPGLFAVRGAWPAVGVEFNFPNSHCTATLETVEADTEVDADGSASIIVGDLECCSRMSWSVRILLRPDPSAIEPDSKLHNFTDFTERYYYWINAACPIYPESEIIYPETTDRLLTHPPMDATRLGYLNWPEHDGSAINRFKNIKQHFPVFAEKMTEDFFGIYHHDHSFGLAHVADRTVVKGRKLWTFGNARDGKIFIDLLSDDRQDYCELQTGPFRLQSDYRLLSPGDSHCQTDYWLPVAGTGGFNLACREFTAHINLGAAGGRLRLCPARRLEGLAIQVWLDKEISREYSIDTQPGRLVEIELSGGNRLLFRHNGRLLASYRTPAERQPSSAVIDWQRPLPVVSPERKAVYQQEHADDSAAAASAAAGTSAAAAAIAGRLALRRNQLSRARYFLDLALARDSHHPEALLYRGELHCSGQEFEAAETDWMRAAETGRGRRRARFKLAQLALRQHQFTTALSRLIPLCGEFPHDSRLWHLRAVAERRLGIDNRASLEAGRRAFRWDPLGWGERFLAGGAPAVGDQFRMEAVCAYCQLDDREAAIRLLQGEWTANIAIARYYLAALTGRKPKNPQWNSWPAFRREDEAILRQFQNPESCFQLGCLLAAQDRWEEAVVRLLMVRGPLQAAARSLLMFYYWKIDRNVPVAAGYAAAVGPEAATKTRIAAAAILQEAGQPEAALQLFTLPPAAFEADLRLQLARIQALLCCNQPESVPRLFAASHFTLCEGKLLSRELYECGYFQLARQAEATGNDQAAMEYYLKATEYPENVGIGAPAANREAEGYFHAALAARRAGKEPLAQQYLERAAAAGDGLAIPFFPLQFLVPEAGTERIDRRYYRNLRYRIKAMEQLGRDPSALRTELETYADYLAGSRRSLE